MVKVVTTTQTRAAETSERRTSTKELLVPTLEEIIGEIEKEISWLSEEGKNALARKIMALVEELKETPASGRFAKAFNPEKVNICIIKWRDSWAMFDRMSYPGDYSSILLPGAIEVEGVDFYPVLVYNTKELYIHFVK